MRLPRPSTSSTSISSSLAGSNSSNKKPAPPPIKPKPSFIDRIGEKVHTLTKSSKTLSSQENANKPSCLSRTGSPKSERDHSATRTVSIDAPTTAKEQAATNAAVERDKNAAISREMGMSPDVVQHYRRLTEEHDKLQMEYARLRMQQMDNAATKLLSASTQNLHKDINLLHTAYSDTHLDTIPEDGPTALNRNSFTDDKQGGYNEDYVHHLESLVHGYRAEILRVQDEARKMQRRYWEQVMGSEEIDVKVESGKQVFELINKQEEKQKEVAELSKRIQDVQSQLASCNQELQKCHNALQDYQYQIDSGEHERHVLERKLKDAKSDLAEAKESVEFLQAERTTLAESLLEVEQNLATTKLQLEKETATVRDLSQRNRKLYSKLQEKNLQLQLLHADLESTQGRARDMLVSQGAQLTMGAVAISQLSSRVHSLLSSTLEYAAIELGLEKEVHYEINIDEFDDLDDEHLSPVFDMSSSSSHEKLSKSNGSAVIVNGKGGSPNTEDCLSPLDMEGQGKSTSLVQSIIQALEQSNKDKVAGSTPTSPTKNVSKSDDRSSENGDSQDGKTKPVGTATAFRNEEQDRKSEDGESKKTILNGDLGIPHHLKSPRDDEASLEGQAKHANMILNKLVNVLGMVQKKYSTDMTDMEKEISKLKVEIEILRKDKVHGEVDVKKKTNLVEDLMKKLDEAQKELARERGKQEGEVNSLQDEIQELKTKCASLQAMNNEQAHQLKEEVGKLVKSTGPSNPMVDAMAICDKLVLKQEIVRLKELLKEKDDVLKRLAAKFARHKKVWEENYQKAEAEVNKLDDVIEKVVQILESNPELVKNSEPLSNLLEKLKSGTLYGDNSKESEHTERSNANGSTKVDAV